MIYFDPIWSKKVNYLDFILCTLKMRTSTLFFFSIYAIVTSNQLNAGILMTHHPSICTYLLIGHNDDFFKKQSDF